MFQRILVVLFLSSLGATQDFDYFEEEITTTTTKETPTTTPSTEAIEQFQPPELGPTEKPVYTERPTFSTEAPNVDTERPTFSTEAPNVDTKPIQCKWKTV